MQALGGAAEAFLFSHGQEVLQLFQVDRHGLMR
jgi:hypothetical protein